MSAKARYLAGFFDGEGCVGVYEKKGSKVEQDKGWSSGHELVVTICNTYKPLIKEIYKTFGGSMYTNRSGRTRNLHVWRASAGTAYKFLQQILPFLVIKRKEVVLAIKFQERYSKGKGSGSPNNFLSGKELLWRNSVVSKLKIMKRHNYV